MSSYFLQLAGILFLYMNFWFVVSVIKKRNDVADVAWGLGFVLLAWSSFFMANQNAPLGILVSLLVTIWGGRLASHIYSRNKNKTEDYRYLAWRQSWGKWFYLRSYFQVFILQGIFLYLIILPVLIINMASVAKLNLLVAIGVVIWLVGFFFETVGDWQLTHFIKNPENKGKLITSGLWAYTRHPNYFGEVTQWWGIWLMAMAVPNGLLTIIGPLTITILILKVSGIPMLEKKMASHPDFENYKNRVGMFLPLPPKNFFRK